MGEISSSTAAANTAMNNPNAKADFTPLLKSFITEFSIRTHTQTLMPAKACFTTSYSANPLINAEIIEIITMEGNTTPRVAATPPTPSSPSHTLPAAPHSTHSPASGQCCSQDPPASLASPKDSPSPAEDTIRIPHPPASSKATPPPQCVSEFPFPANTSLSHLCPQSYHAKPQRY